MSLVEGRCCDACEKRIRFRRILWIFMVLVFSTGLFTITLPLALLFKEVFNWVPDLLPMILLALPLAIGFWIGLVSIPKKDRQLVSKSRYKNFFLSNKLHKPTFGFLNLIRRRILAFHLKVDKQKQSTVIPLSSFEV
ncbi:hypothetical protein OAG68_01780 [bacterium]|nr:hypothetical protein [bacterium]